MRIFSYLAKKVGDLTTKYSNLPESYIKRSYEQVTNISMIDETIVIIFLTSIYSKVLFFPGLLEEPYRLPTVS